MSIVETKVLTAHTRFREGEIMTSSKKSGISENSIAALSYISFLPAVVFLMVPRYKKNSYIRFHAWQSIELSVLTVIATYAVGISLLYGPLVYMGVTWLTWVASAMVWMATGVQALHGKRARLPLIGAWAERLATANRWLKAWARFPFWAESSNWHSAKRAGSPKLRTSRRDLSGLHAREKPQLKLQKQSPKRHPHCNRGAASLYRPRFSLI